MTAKKRQGKRKIRSIAFFENTGDAMNRQVLKGILRYVAAAPHLRLQTLHHPGFNPTGSLADFHGDGVIGYFSRPQSAALCRQRGIRFVAFGDIRQEVRPMVSANYRKAGQLAATTLLAAGFKRFLFFSLEIQVHGKSLVTFSGSEALNGFSERLNQAGVKPGTLILPAEALDEPKSWKALTRKIARQLMHFPPPFAVYTADSNCGPLLIHACEQAGLRVPIDVAVLCNNNDEILCNSTVPAISAIHLGHERVGYEAARLLDLLFQGKADPETRILLDPLGVVERESTTGPETGDPHVAQAISLMGQSLDKPVDMNRLASRLGISRRLLELRFRKELDSSPARELLRLRIEKAQRLLLGSHLNTREIASACGFTHVSHFQLVFRKQTGQPPGTWRRQNQTDQQRPRLTGKTMDLPADPSAGRQRPQGFLGETE